MRSPLPAVLLLLPVMLVGCDTASPVAVQDDGPQLDYANGPADLPNVFRFESEFAVSIQDPETDLLAIVGLPADPSSHIGCAVFGGTGTETFQTVPIQDAGQMQGVIHSIIIADNMNLNVYQLSTFNGFCRTPALARGVGKLVNTDNDLTFSNTRNNTWGFHMTGPVTILATGEASHLNAQNRFEGNADTGARLVFRRVRLN